MLKNSLTILTILVLSGTLAYGVPINCTQPTGIADVLTLNPDGCFLDGNVYDMWFVSGVNQQTVGLGSATGVDGGVHNLRFITRPNDPDGAADTRLRYRVTGSILGIDLGVTNAFGATTITENVCTVNSAVRPAVCLLRR